MLNHVFDAPPANADMIKERESPELLTSQLLGELQYIPDEALAKA